MNIKEKWIEACNKHKIYFFITENIRPKRLQRLLAIACCNHIKYLLKDQRSLTALEVSELYADGKASNEELKIANENAWIPSAASYCTDAAAYHNAAYYASLSNSHISNGICEITIHNSKDREHQGKLFEIMFQHNFEINWKNDTTTHIAQSIYDTKNWYDFPILADALEDAGCADAEVLNYCRSEGPFFR